ncbi:hypothetical protein [Microbacterium sp. NPDC089695]|uniref:hypothetical protein n=1 Tax=Microbacterium sp. NPDC089695 TaxID=3364198 RepID=UPI0037F103E3
MIMPPLCFALRTFGVLACDLAFVAAGGLVLWHNGGTTVVNGNWQGVAIFLGLASIATCLRAVAARQRPLDAPLDPRIDRIVSASELLLLGSVIAVWLMGGEYFWGWIATFFALCIVCAATLQLLTDVLTARNSRAAKANSSPVIRRHLLSLEAHRLIVVALAGVAVALTSPIHFWSALLINPLLILILLPMGVSVAFGLVWRPRHRAIHQITPTQDPGKQS